MTVPSETWEPADVLLADGCVAVVRPLTAADGPALHALHESVSVEAIRLRFFSPSRVAAHRYVDHVLASPSTLALVAETGGELLGLATAEPFGVGRAEVAFLVGDAARGRGVGTLLLEHLAALASFRGVTAFEADVLMENHAMLSVFSATGRVEGRASDSGVVVLTLGTRAGAQATARSDEREFRAEARSLAALLQPRAVAVVGAGTTRLGSAVLQAVRRGGFAGRVVATHPTATQVDGVPAHPSLAAAGPGIDLVVASAPMDTLPDLVRDAAAAGARAVVALPTDDVAAGAEHDAGHDAAVARRRLVAAARAASVRLVGPGSLGVLLNDPAVRLNATFQDVVPPTGGLALVSQSGGVGIALLRRAAERGVGVHCLVSLGEKADVSSNDLLAAWYEDPQVRAAGLYLESFGNAARFARFARRFALRKPLLAVLGGRSRGDGGGVGVDALFAQAGVIGCRSTAELLGVAALLAEQPLPRGARVAVLTNAGGMGALLADAAADAGLDLCQPSPALQDRLGALVGCRAAATNPIDAGAAGSAEVLGDLLDELLGSGEVDAVAVAPVATGLTDLPAVSAALLDARARHPDLPVVGVPVGVPLDGAAPGPGITEYDGPGPAMEALARVARYAAWTREEAARDTPATAPAEAAAARRTARELLGRRGSAWLDGSDAAALLASYGLASVGVLARSATAAARSASEVGLPVAVKVVDAGTVKRTEAGLVRTGLRTARQVQEAFRDFRAAVDGACEVLVQPMVSGAEVALGVVRDPVLGPLVTLADSGASRDRDTTFLLPPVTAAEARRAVGSRRSATDGDDLDVQVGLVLALGRLAVDVPEVAALQLDAVVDGPAGCTVVDAKVRLATPVGPDAGAPRQLRRAD
ncbi:GNAT family N-acetyltransferase [Nocardioides abyssi]|uniref:GNAT family N-acetyltransferase n=1 Tax=Nocardioides abyssi TaxID=3058370 RepID=A0ABT8EV62_9ACTN|nr:GNAT family N-acetyltransferase [Nocardioides abyssi]MDN4162057.1 GNAT family N-acetyltransferase [Nocardioides abyssi]